MRKTLLIVILVIGIIAFSTLPVFAESSTTEITDISTSNNTDDIQETGENNIFLTDILDLLKSTQSWISLVMILVLVIYMIVYKKEIPKKWTLIIPAVLIVFTFFARLLLRSKHADFLVTIFITVIQVAYFFVIINFWTKTQTITHETSLPKNSIEKKACSLIQKLINKSHYAIECIQLYAINSSSEEDCTSFQIDFLGGSSKQGININALFSTSLKIPTEHITAMDTIQKMYTQLDIDGGISESGQTAVSALIYNEIEKLKKTLNNITKAEDISVKECCLARILLVYISLYATINSHDTYIGLGRDSLGLNNSGLEPVLFTYERTGILGAILLNHIPYIFSYRRGGGKKRRFYYAFSCGAEKKYIVLISMKHKNNSYYIDYHLSSNLESISQKLCNILDADNDQKKVGD